LGKIMVKAAVGLAACALAPLPSGSRASAPERQALWLTVQACVADFRLTGAPFPCLMVNLKAGEARGYVVLRAPFDPDTILTPTRKVSGIEDPWLRSRAAPNYFADAWRARALLKGPDGRPPAPGDFALAVNSELTRSQDQFHIHLGCLAPSIKRWLPAVASRLPIGAWIRAGAFRGLRTGQEDPTDVRPLRLAAEAMGGRVNFARMTMLVAEVRIAGRAETVILVSYPDASDAASAESVLDSDCTGEPRASAAK
jgi:CDP-diacylglycerol pyrophosphatase